MGVVRNTLAVLVTFTLSTVAVSYRAGTAEARHPGDHGRRHRLLEHQRLQPRLIDRIANEGAIFTDYYGQQSCTAGRAAFITGQSPLRTGLLKVGLPGAKQGLSALDPTLADLLQPAGYATGQFGKNHLGGGDSYGSIDPAGFDRIRLSER